MARDTKNPFYGMSAGDIARHAMGSGGGGGMAARSRGAGGKGSMGLRTAAGLRHIALMNIKRDRELHEGIGKAMRSSVARHRKREAMHDDFEKRVEKYAKAK